MNLMTLKNFIGNALIPVVQEMTTSYIAAVVITGLTVVFIGLIILILFVWAFGKFFTKNKKISEPVSQEIPVTTITPIPETDENEDEIIAVISAAVAAMGKSEGKNYRLKSVRPVKNKPSRSAWSIAGIQNDTNPF